MLAEWPSQQSYQGFPASGNSAVRLTIPRAPCGTPTRGLPCGRLRPRAARRRRCLRGAWRPRSLPGFSPNSGAAAPGPSWPSGHGQLGLGCCHRGTRAGWETRFARFNKKCCRAAAQVKTTVQIFANVLCEVKHKNNAWKQHSLLAFCLPFERGVRLA